MATVIDTHQAVKDLAASGFNEQQAEAITRLWQGAREELATRRDLELLRKDIEQVEQRLRKDIEQVEQRLRKEIELAEQRLTIRLGGMMAAAIVLTGAFVALF